MASVSHSPQLHGCIFRPKRHGQARARPHRSHGGVGLPLGIPQRPGREDFLREAGVVRPRDLRGGTPPPTGTRSECTRRAGGRILPGSGATPGRWGPRGRCSRRWRCFCDQGRAQGEIGNCNYRVLTKNRKGDVSKKSSDWIWEGIKMVILIGGASHMARPSWRRGSWSDTATPCSRSACWRWGSSAAGRSSEPRGLQPHGDKLGQPRATYRIRQHGNRSMRLPCWRACPL